MAQQPIRVALLGLGQVGHAFAEHLLERSQEDGMPIEVAAVADHHPDNPVAMGFAHSNVPVYQNGLDVTELGEDIDIIFDLTGNAELRRGLRDRLADQGNRHTVIAPEVMARMLWCFFDEGGEMPLHGSGGY
jgi:homoserine dehydrogenase